MRGLPLSSRAAIREPPTACNRPRMRPHGCVWTVVAIELVVVGVGMLAGWGVRYAMQQTARNKMREILQQDAQMPFTSKG